MKEKDFNLFKNGLFLAPMHLKLAKNANMTSSFKKVISGTRQKSRILC
jgi:hypothetical protein